MTGTDFSPFMVEVAQMLLGTPNKHMSGKDELRFGTNGSVSVDVAKGTYYDFSEEKGGGVLDLIARQTGHQGKAAVDWLKDQGFPIDDAGAAPARANGAVQPKAKRRIVKTYDYVDETGKLLFQVVRFEPKQFVQRRPSKMSDPPEKVKDGWVWSVKGVRQVPYRLPEILEAVAQDRPIFVVEGEKDADNLWALGIPATCNAMGAGKWPEGLSQSLAGADVVLLPDNDDVGEAHMAAVAADLATHASSVRLVHLPDLPPKGDVSDWLQAGHSADELYAVVDREGAAFGEALKRLHFGSVWFAEAERVLDEVEWLVYGLLTVEDMSLVYGESRSGKSFFATHLAMGIAQGIEVLGRRTDRGGVIYLAAEGKRGFKKRLKAYSRKHGLDAGMPLPFVLVPAAIDLYAKDGPDLTTLLTDMVQIEAQMRDEFDTRTALIVVDTWAAVSPGANENASEDVSRIVKNVQRFREVCPHAHIMIVHHKNAAGERPRGHGSLFAGIDNALEVSVDEYKNRSVKIAKMKDGEDGIEIGFRLETITLGQNSYGEPITSCVVVPTDQGLVARAGKGPVLSMNERVALDALREAVLSLGVPAPVTLGLSSHARVVEFKHWRNEAFKRGLFGDDATPETVKKQMTRIGTSLVAKGVIGRNQPYVWLARDPASKG